MLSISATPQWHTTHPGAAIGLLEISGVIQPARSDRLDELKQVTEINLRQRYQGYTRQDFLALPVMAAYDQYYRRFDKTFHVLLQLESIVLKSKNLPSVCPLVDAVFAAEIETFILTAGHDADKLCPPVTFDISRAGDQITQLNGTVRFMRAGDMVMRADDGVSCSIIYGQDNRSSITAQTSHVLYVSYVPPGVPSQAVTDHQISIIENVRLFSRDAIIEQCKLLYAGRD